MGLTTYAASHMMEPVEVITTDEFADWYGALDVQAAEAVVHVVTLPEELGVTLTFPHSSKINGSRYPLRELRVQAGGRPLRVFYAFDPRRDAVLLIGGDKTGKDRFYQEMVPRAEGLWAAYLAEQSGGLHDDDA